MFCPQCGRENPDESKFCQGCGAPLDEQAESAESAAAQPDGGEPQKKLSVAALGGALAGKKGARSIVIIAAVALVAIALVIGLIKLIPALFGGGKDAFVYSTDDHELMFRKSLSAKAEDKELTDEFADYAIFSEDGKVIYYTDGSSGSSTCDLYTISVADAGKKNPDPERIDRDVYKWSLDPLKKGGILYEKSGDLYFYDGKDKNKVAKECDDYWLDDDEKYIYYTVEGSDYTTSLYRVDYRKGGDKELLLKDVDGIYSGYDAKTLVFGKSNGDGTCDVYSQKIGGDKSKIVSDVDVPLVADTEGGKVRFLYAEHEDYLTYTLKLYNDGTTEKLASDVSGYEYDLESSVYLYKKDDEWRQNVGGVESKLKLDDDYEIINLFVLGSEAVIEVYDDDYDYHLLGYKIGKSALESKGEITDDYSSLSLREDESGKKALYYFQDVNKNGDTGNLICYDGKENLIAKEVNAATIYSTGLICTREDERNGEFTLNILKKSGEKMKVADDVSSFAVLGEKKVLFVMDDDLYLWNGSKNEKLASDVVNVWAPRYARAMFFRCSSY
ncbi:MAG: zinc ribbon domain-containing protein [Oscillospiraceae bacterium]|nr:zinc ribbon domain-containing protein [Oscillospiraceae bacterium]